MDGSEEEHTRPWENMLKHQPLFESTARRRGPGPGGGARLGKGHAEKTEESSISTDEVQWPLSHFRH